VSPYYLAVDKAPCDGYSSRGRASTHASKKTCPGTICRRLIFPSCSPRCFFRPRSFLSRDLEIASAPFKSAWSSANYRRGGRRSREELKNLQFAGECEASKVSLWRACERKGTNDTFKFPALALSASPRRFEIKSNRARQKSFHLEGSWCVRLFFLSQDPRFAKRLKLATGN